MMGLGNGGVVWGEETVPTGLAAVIVAATPFWMAGVEACRADGERLSKASAAGFALGFSGILLLVWPQLVHGAGTASRAGFLGMCLFAFIWVMLSGRNKLVMFIVLCAGTGVMVLLPGPLQNRLLDRRDNAAFGLQLAGAGRRVAFLETYHGYGRSSGLRALPLALPRVGQLSDRPYQVRLRSGRPPRRPPARPDRRVH